MQAPSERGTMGLTRWIGSAMERRAERHLRRQGLHVEARNFHSRFGEIDLVMRDGDTLVFVEVRYRRDTRWGSAAATVDGRKQARIRAAAAHYLQRHGRADAVCRFDVVCIDEGSPLRWLRGAF